MKQSSRYLAAFGVASGTVLLLVLASGAVGIIGDGGHDDRVYVAVPVVLGVGTVVARLRPHAMMLVLAATALTQLVVTGVALLDGIPDGASVLDVVGINAMFAALFCLSAWLFRRAAGQRRAVTPEGAVQG